MLLEHLSGGVAQGVPLEETFRALADDLTDRRLRAVAVQLTEQLESGADLGSALASMQPVLPTHMRHALAIGARSGNLSAILTGLSESELVRKQMQRELRAVLAYPLLVLLSLLLLTLLMTMNVIPMFAVLYDDFDLELPILTVYLLKFSPWIPMFLFGTFASCLVMLVIGYLIAGKRYLHWIRTALPLFGRAWLWSGQHEFATLMATLTRQKVSVTEALACTVESLRDRNLARAVRLASARCEQGMLLSQSLSESIHFDPTLTSLIQWGESQQTLPEALTEAARTYEQQMEFYIQFLHRIIPPLLLALVASVVFFMLAALMVPLVDLINGLMY